MRHDDYDLVDVDGNAFSIMAYVVKAMHQMGFSKAEISEYKTDAMSLDYDFLLYKSIDALTKCNERLHAKNAKSNN